MKYIFCFFYVALLLQLIPFLLCKSSMSVHSTNNSSTLIIRLFWWLVCRYFIFLFGNYLLCEIFCLCRAIWTEYLIDFCSLLGSLKYLWMSWNPTRTCVYSSRRTSVVSRVCPSEPLLTSINKLGEWQRPLWLMEQADVLISGLNHLEGYFLLFCSEIVLTNGFCIIYLQMIPFQQFYSS